MEQRETEKGESWGVIVISQSIKVCMCVDMLFYVMPEEGASVCSV